MAAHSTFAGLRRLAAKAGIKIGANDLPDEPGAGDDADEGEGEGDGNAEDESTTGEGAGSGDQGAGNEGNGEGEGEGDGEGDDTGTGEGEGGSGGSGAQSGQQPQRRSADFLAGQRYGAQQTAGRFAAVLASPVARANLEMATDLLATSNMTPRAIIEHCDRYKGESSAKRLLDTTPKPNLGVDRSAGKGGGDDAAAARTAAATKANKAVARQAAQGQPVRRSRRAAAEKPQKQEK